MKKEGQKMNKNKKIALIVIELIAAIVLVIVAFNFDKIFAFATHTDEQQNTFATGNISATVQEPNYTNNQIIKPNEEIVKDPTFSNNGTVNSYIRAQVYVPISDQIKYVNNNEELVTPAEEIELFTYQINPGWVEVDNNVFSGIYEDENGNRYKVHTYKYTQGGTEKIIEPNETIASTLFDTVKVINYADTDTAKNLNLQVAVIAVQADGGTADQLWSYFANQNGAGIVGVK
jgi:hypothetical protein